MSETNTTDTTERTLGVGGMTCQGCVRRVTEVITKQGAGAVRVDLASGEARFEASDAQVQAVRQALDTDGWEVRT
jgi:copper chaperone CopZ